jgi:predicted nucleic acid-binding protein
MTVIDASLATDYLVDFGARGEWARRVLPAAGELHAPQLLDYEVVSAIRGLGRARKLRPARAEAALQDLLALDVRRYSPLAFLERIWELRHRLSVYDAAYVALAEALGVPLLTTDQALARSRGHGAAILAFPGS